MNYKKSVIVTGAGGLIGESLCKYLYANGVDVVAMYRTKPFHTIPWKYFVSDIENGIHISFSFPFDYVIHCAANVPQTSIHLEEVAQKNEIIDKEILKFVKANNSILIYTSGTSVYGFEPNENIAEDFGSHSIKNPYFDQKIHSENLFYNKMDKIIILRISAPYNSNMNANTVLKLFITKALNNEDILFHGTGARQQDFIHTKDISSAILCCLKINKPRGIYNIATGMPISMKHLAEKIVSMIPNCKSQILPSGFPDLQENFKAKYNITKAKKELSWLPEITLDMGIADWIKKETTI